MELKVVAPSLMWKEAVLVVQYIPLRIQLRSGFQATDLQRLDGGLLLQEAEGSRAEDGSWAAAPAFTPTAGSRVHRLRFLVGAEFRAGSHGVSGLQAAVAEEGAHVGFGVTRHGELGALRHLVARQSAVVAGDWSLTRDWVAFPGERKLEAIRTLPGARSDVEMGVRILTGR